MTDTLAPHATAAMVPGEFAEKAMASLMSLHSELMDEKERRVELYRKLMEREQTVAELRMYIRMLEEKLEPKVETAAVSRPQPVAAPVREVRVAPPPPADPPAPMPRIPPVSAYTLEPTAAPPVPPRVTRPKVDGWKTW